MYSKDYETISVTMSDSGLTQNKLTSKAKKLVRTLKSTIATNKVDKMDE